MAKDGNDLVAPCGSFDCCDLGSFDYGPVCYASELLQDAVARADHAEALCGATSDSGPTDDKTSLGDESPCVCDSGQHDTKESSTAVIVIVVLAAVLLVAAAVYLGRKRRVAGLQLHRESIPTIGGDAGVEG